MSDRKREPNGLIQTSVTIDADTHAQLVEFSKWSRASMSDVTTHALRCLFSSMSLARSAMSQRELSIVSVSDQAATARVEVTPIDQGLRRRQAAYVRSMVDRVCRELVKMYESGLNDVENQLNNRAFGCALYHDQWSDELAIEFVTTGVQCGLSEAESMRIVKKAVADAAKRQKREPNCTVPVASARASAQRGRMSASDAAEALLDQLRKPGKLER